MLQISAKRRSPNDLVSPAAEKKPRQDSSPAEKPRQDPTLIVDELKVHIFSFLNSPRDLLSCAQVCRSWRPVAQDDSLWRSLSIRDFPNAEHSREAPSALREYQKNYTVQTNVRKGIFVPRDLIEHAGHVHCVARFKEMMCSGDEEGELISWDLKNYKPLSCTLPMGNKRLTFLSNTEEGDLLSASFNNGVCIQHLPSGELREIKAPQVQEAYLHYVAADRKLLCGQSDGTVIILNLDLEKQMATEVNRIEGNPRYVVAFAHADGWLITGSEDTSQHRSQLMIWKVEEDWKKITEVAAFRGGVHSCWMHSLVCGEGMLFSGMADSRIMIWDLKQGRCLAYLELNEGERHAGVTALTYGDGLLFAGYWDSSVRVWDVKNRICLHARVTKIDPVSKLFLATHGKLFVTHIHDRMLLLLDFSASHHEVLQDIITRFLELATTTLSPDKAPTAIFPHMEYGHNSIMASIVWFTQNDPALQNSNLVSLSVKLYRKTMTRFSKMPEKMKEQIYSEFQKLLANLGIVADGSLAFNDSIEITMPPGEFLNLKAQAIENYILKSKAEEQETPKGEET